jgi:phospholipid/cholesterol/gamma-HCH transport system substrate-binding protein
METRAYYVAVGTFVLAIIFLGFVAVISLGRVEFAQELRRYYVFFTGSVAGLSRGSVVQYNGIPVGRVVDIRVDPDNVQQIQVTVEIDTNLVKIKTDALAYIDTNFLSGVGIIQIRGGTQEAKDLEAEPGHRYPVIAAGSSVLQRVSETGPLLLDRLNVVVNNLNSLLNEQNRQAVSDSLQNMQTVTAALIEPAKQLNEVMDNANDTVLALRSLLDNVKQSYAAKGGLKDQASQTLDDYDRLAKDLDDTGRQLRMVIEENRPGLRGFTQNTLNQISGLVSDMQRFISGLSRFVSTIERDPARLLFGERREGYRPQ